MFNRARPAKIIFPKQKKDQSPKQKACNALLILVILSLSSSLYDDRAAYRGFSALRAHGWQLYRETAVLNFTFLSLMTDTSLSCNNISNKDLFTFVSLSFEIRKTSCKRS